MKEIDFNGLDTAVHGPIRLGIVTTLRIHGPTDFTTLKKRLAVSDGAIGPQLLKLEEVGYLKSDKAFVGRKPKTTYSLTPGGRKALNTYVQQMQQLLDSLKRQDSSSAE